MSFLSAILLTAATPVLAQVTVDLHALQALPERAPATHQPRSSPLAMPTPPPLGAPASGGPAVVTRVAPQISPPTVQPTMPETIPETATIAPLTAPEPPAGSAPPPPPPVSETAAATATPTPAGLRLIFAPGQSDLSPDSTTSIKQFTQNAPPNDASTFNILAYSPGKADDPSTARRVSLSRAMAVRSALVASGVPSARIFVRALGEQYGNGPPDRVDIGLNSANAPSASATAR